MSAEVVVGPRPGWAKALVRTRGKGAVAGELMEWENEHFLRVEGGAWKLDPAISAAQSPTGCGCARAP